MSGLHRISLAVLCACAAVVLPAAIARPAPPAADVTVEPAQGGAHTTFVVAFTAPDPSGTTGGVERRYTASVTGPLGTDCRSEAEQEMPSADAGQRVQVLLAGQPGWCRGVFHGRVQEWESASCPGHESRLACPDFIVIRTLGTFKFDVVSGLADETPPEFAGLKRAVQCIPGPMRPGEERPVFLSWPKATDDVAASNEIVYDIFASRTSGGEDFSHPSWSVEGATNFTTPALAPNLFFVVRARDQAGNEDGNRVEHSAYNPCV